LEDISIAIYCLAHIAQNIRQLIQAQTYERIICDLMNSSSVVFPHRYQQVTEQAHGECDFVDINNGRKYDAKLLFSSEQCELLAKGTSCLLEWIISIRKEIEEASVKVMHKQINAQGTILYAEMLKRLQSVAVDEIAILFIPYPIVPASENSVFLQFASDIVSITYDTIVKVYPQRFNDKQTIIIYPSVIDGKLVLRDLATNTREYLPIEPLSPYIVYELAEHPNENADILIFK